MGHRASRPARAQGGRNLEPFGSQLCVVIPVLNEEAHVQAAIHSVIQGTCSKCQPEIVVVDGGSSDNTVAMAIQAGRGVKILHSPRGRGVQMNMGWQSTTRPWCLFLHGDSELPPRYLTAMETALTPACTKLAAPPKSSSLAEQQASSRQRITNPVHTPGTLPAGPLTYTGAIYTSNHNTVVGGQVTVQGQVVEGDYGGDLAGLPVRPRGPERRFGRQRATTHTTCPTWCRCAQHKPLFDKTKEGISTDKGQCSCSSSPMPAVHSAGASCKGWPWQWPLPVWPWKEQRQPPVWGHFQTIETEWHDSWRGQLLSRGVMWRSTVLGLPYGDQGIFATRRVLEEVGGLPDWPLLEDLELVRRLKRSGGPPAVLPMAIKTSGRRWDQVGFWRTCVLNQAIMLAWAVGVSPHVLSKWYYNVKPIITGKGYNWRGKGKGITGKGKGRIHADGSAASVSGVRV